MKKISKADPLRNTLLMKIRNGLISPGEAIPSENQLCMIYSLTRPTVRKVLAELCDMGLLEKKPGIGAFVKTPRDKSCNMEREIHIGSDVIFRGSEYYAQPIAAGIQNSAYGKHCFFSPFTLNGFSAADYPHLDALLLNNLPSDAKVQVTAFKKPVVFLNRTINIPNAGTIYIDNYRETRRAVEYLVKYGHRKIAVIGASDPSGCIRLQAFEDTLTANGITPDPELYLIDRDYDTPERMNSFLKKSKFTAMFFTNGSAFLKTFQFFRAKLGDDFNQLQVLIFDDISKMNVFDKIPAAFVRMPLREMGELAVEYLRRKVCDPEYPVIDKCLSCSLLIK